MSEMRHNRIWLNNKKTAVCLGGHPWPKGKKKVMLNNILRNAILPVIPDECDAEVDGCGQEFKGFMWGNDVHGDCECVSAANWERAAEYHEQGKVINITTDDVVNWYFTLTGGPDSGLNDSTVLDAWRATGFPVSEPIPVLNKANIERMKKLKKHPLLVKALAQCPCHQNPTPTPPAQTQTLTIYDSAGLDRYEEIRCAIALLYGARVAIAIPHYAMEQFDAGKPWDYDPKGDQTLDGYHSIYFKKYYKGGGFQCRTWGTTQDITEAYLDHYLDGAYCMVDNSDSFLKNSPIDLLKLEAEKQAIAG